MQSANQCNTAVTAGVSHISLKEEFQPPISVNCSPTLAVKLVRLTVDQRQVTICHFFDRLFGELQSFQAVDLL